MNSERPSDPANEATWVAEQRASVAEYLRGLGVVHGRIGAWPAWHVHPYLAIWAIESMAVPGRVGFWAISGDVATDYVSFADAGEPRAVLRHFARVWAEYAGAMRRGERHPDWSIGEPEQSQELGELLARRAALLQNFADDDAIWDDDEG